MKYILTLENYYTYKDFEKGRWGTPSEIEEDLRMTIINLLTYAGISDNLDDVEYEDQSTDKGIKWQITIKHAEGQDILHAYKKTNWRGQYELYLNKKKSTAYDIQQTFLKKFISSLDQFLAFVKSYDFYADYIDDGRQWSDATANNNDIVKNFNSLSASDKRKAKKEILKHFNSKELKPQIDQIFKS
jgi:hypothetical protein